MPILTNSARVVIAESIALRPVHLAWGSGDGSWVNPPGEPIGATSLLSEVGRKKVTVKGFVVSDPAGPVVTPDGRWSISDVPTNNLYLSTQFDFQDAPSDIIREIGVFVGTVTDPALPPGQTYFLPSQVVSPGRLLHMEYRQPIYRSPTNTAQFETVITF